MENNKLDIIGSNVCGIYGFMFPDNKWLVGYSSQMTTRLGRYFAGERLNRKVKEGLNKYGWAPIKIYVLEECENVKSVLLEREKYWSQQLNSVSDGYNVIACGYDHTTTGTLGDGLKTTIYNEAFRTSVSEAMLKHHANREKVKSPKKYNNWKKLYISAKQINPNIYPPENLGTLPNDTEFSIEWNKLTKWNRKRVSKKII